MARSAHVSQAIIDADRSPPGWPLVALLCFTALCANACRHPQAGVLTLAPGGMHTTGACVAQADGTLTMSAGARAASTVYVDAGAVTITVTAAPSSLQHHPRIEMWFAGEKVGTATLESAQAHSLPFHVRARAAGPTPLRLGYEVEAGQGGGPVPTLHVEKVVITQP